MRRKVFSGTETSLIDRRDLGDREIIFVSYEHNSEKTFCLHFIKSTSQQETLLGKRENISPHEQNKIIDLMI